MELTLKSVEVAVICLVLTALLGLKIRTIGSRDKELPPGPKTTPVLGSVLDFPTNYPHLKGVAVTLAMYSTTRLQVI